MGKMCDCPRVVMDNPDKDFEELIKAGLICDVCANTYRECCRLAGKEPDF
ncbi:MAG: hypothetical protein ABIB71_01115 [Candidatus Woesearchaeota archaeon]